MALAGGVYRIDNIVSGKVYIGSAEVFEKRKYDHFYCLKNGIHANRHLQNAYNKHGDGALVFSIIEYCQIDELAEREQFYLDTLLFAQEYIRKEDTRFLKLGYNLCPIAGTTRYKKHSEETLAKMKVIGKSLWEREGFREKQMASFTPERIRITQEKKNLCDKEQYQWK